MLAYVGTFYVLYRVACCQLLSNEYESINELQPQPVIRISAISVVSAF